ncbi:MAG: rnd [Friedmanniella sp.]|nr:rnd [Friedmanniella sp.]
MTALTPDLPPDEATSTAGAAVSGATQAEMEAPEVVVLSEPADGVPQVIANPEDLDAAIASLRAGTGPVAVDAERAHGFRYSQRAYLLQLRRQGSGTHLIDPVAFGQPADLSPLAEALGEAEWVIHAASQDLPCLFEVGLVPRTLFDTELAGRLLGYPRVALGTLIEEFFEVRLLKEHSASDWSSRPLPTEWLSYAALDVELLVELRDRLAAQLVESGKWDWAQQEFAALVAGAGISPEPRTDPWRRTSGIHKVRTRRALAVVSALWLARDDIARRQDRAPSKILPDVAISEIAAIADPDRSALRQVSGFSRRQARRYEVNWVQALEAAAAVPDHELPPLHITTEGPPAARMWAAKDPVAAARLSRVRNAVMTRATEVNLPAENLMTPDHLRRLAWRPPEPVTAEAVDAALASYGARPWQRELTVDRITAALAVKAPVPDTTAAATPLTD